MKSFKQVSAHDTSDNRPLRDFTRGHEEGGLVAAYRDTSGGDICNMNWDSFQNNDPDLPSQMSHTPT